MDHPKLWRWVALIGFFGTMAILLLWITWISPPRSPKSIALAIALIPMLAPLRGILHGKNYTHSWASFLSLPYFAYGVDALIHKAENNWLGLVLMASSLLWFFGCIYFARYNRVINQTSDSASKKES
ncbi:hypothetical protein AB833_02815 [Chromatiales bacterium (ex Bugula neritina AB1)]|nr:hypothetical protein AB833_02815 [Chromatiales bacterium (ex Bugula neritina AB1)]